LFDFTGSNAEEMSFPAGSILKILGENENEWYKAELNGREGYVPANYIQYTIPIWFMSVSKDQAGEILNAMNGPRPRHPDGAFLVRPSQNSPGEMSLSVKIGHDVQHFRILRSGSHDRYYLWSDAPNFTSVNQLVTHYRSASVSRSSNSAYLRDLNFAKVCADYDYASTQPSELTLYRGDVITVIDNSDPSWWDGRLERDNVVYRGSFPANYVSTING